MAANLTNLFNATGGSGPVVAASQGEPSPFSRFANRFDGSTQSPFVNLANPTVTIPGVPTSTSPYDWAGVTGTKPASETSDAQKQADNEANKAKSAGRRQSAKENKNTQDIIDTLIRSIEGYRSGTRPSGRTPTPSSRTHSAASAASTDRPSPTSTPLRR